MRRIVNGEKIRITKWIVTYILISFSLSIVGPVKFIDYKPYRVLLYLFYLICMIGLACVASSRIHMKRSQIKLNGSLVENGLNYKNKTVKSINLFVYLSVLLYIVQFIDLVRTRGLSLSAINFGSIYRGYLHNEFATNSTLIQITTLFAFVPYVAMTGGIIVFREKSFNKRIFLFFALFSICTELLSNGQLAYVVSWVLTIGTYFLFQIVRREKTREGISKKKIVWKRAIIFAVAFLIIFGVVQDSRSNEYDYDLKNFSTPFYYYDGNHLIYKMLPDSIGNAVAGLCYYISGGYYGLDRNFDTSFYWTRGYGNSKALSSYLNQYLGLEDMYEYAYPLRTEIETGYPSGQYWSTVVPWLAGDFTYVGVGILVFFITMIYLKCYEEWRSKDKILSGIVFMRLTLFFLFIPANNYVVQTRDNLIITAVLLFVYALSSITRRYKFVLRKSI